MAVQLTTEAVTLRFLNAMTIECVIDPSADSVGTWKIEVLRGETVLAEGSFAVEAAESKCSPAWFPGAGSSPATGNVAGR